MNARRNVRLVVGRFDVKYSTATATCEACQPTSTMPRTPQTRLEKRLINHPNDGQLDLDDGVGRDTSNRQAIPTLLRGQVGDCNTSQLVTVAASTGASKHTSFDHRGPFEREEYVRGESGELERSSQNLVATRGNADDCRSLLIQMYCELKSQTQVARPERSRRPTCSRQLGANFKSTVVARECDERLLACDRSRSRIRRQVARRDGAMRILKDDAREADLRELKGESPGDGGLATIVESAQQGRKNDKPVAAYRAEEGDLRIAVVQLAATRSEPYLLSFCCRKFEPYFVNAQRLRETMRKKGLVEGDERSTFCAVLTHGRRLCIVRVTVTPSSSAAEQPSSLARRIEKVGKAMAAKSAVQATFQHQRRSGQAIVILTFTQETGKRVDIIHQSLCQVGESLDGW